MRNRLATHPKVLSSPSVLWWIVMPQNSTTCMTSCSHLSPAQTAGPKLTDGFLLVAAVKYRIFTPQHGKIQGCVGSFCTSTSECLHPMKDLQRDSTVTAAKRQPQLCQPHRGKLLAVLKSRQMVTSGNVSPMASACLRRSISSWMSHLVLYCCIRYHKVDFM